MAEHTTNYNLEKQQGNEFVSIEGINANLDVIDTEIKNANNKADQAFQLASNGKAAIKAAITGVDPEVSIPNDATFAQLADAIALIETGIDTSDATATAEQILAGMTAYVKEAEVIGTMANRGAVNQALPINSSYIIPKGYHNGGGKITQSIPVKTAAIIMPGTTDQVIAAGQYLEGAQAIKGDANLLPANILLGKSIFGVVGNAIKEKKWASGSYTVSVSTEKTFYKFFIGSLFTVWSITVAGLAFKPSKIIIIGHTRPQGYALDVVWTSMYDTNFPLHDSIAHAMLYSYNYANGLVIESKYDIFKADTASAYVNETGFCIPMQPLQNINLLNPPVCVWYAFE